MARDDARRARDLDRKGVRRSKGPALALTVVLVGVVASVATAGLMVATVRSLGDASSATADQATVVSGKLVVHSAHATRGDAGVSTLNLYVGSDGADLDLAGLEVRVEGPRGTQVLRYGGGMDLHVQRDPDGSVTASAPGLNRGDLVELVLHLDGDATGERLLLRWQGSADTTPPVHVQVPAVGAGTILPLSIG